MNKPTLSVICTLICTTFATLPITSIAAESITPSSAQQQVSYQSSIVNVISRGQSVPATFVTPVAKNKELFPLVLIAHGHGGSREENGGLTLLAEKLASRGIASMRMDFPGCGQSQDTFANNTPINMLTDAQNSLAFALEQGQIDLNNIGIFGYSMGGRISLDLATKDSRIKAAGFLAPATDNGNTLIQRIVGGEDIQATLYATASQEEGYAEFQPRFGGTQKLSKEWFDQLTATNPIDKLSKFNGDLMVVCGTEEPKVRKDACNSLLELAKNSAKSVNYADIQDADHGYGFFNGREDVKNKTIDAFVDFFSQKLN